MNNKMLVSGIILIIIYKILDSAGEIFLWLGKLIDLISPCIAGVIIAFFLYTPCKKIKEVLLHTKLKKYAVAISIFCVYTIIFGGVITVVIYFAPVIYKNSEQFINNFPGYINEAEEYLNSNKYLKQLGQTVILNAKGYMGAEKITSYISAIKNIAGNFASVFFGVVISVHLIADGKNIIRYWGKVIKKVAGEKVFKNAVKIKKSLSLFLAYFSGIAIDSIIVAAAISIGFTIMAVPYPLLLGILIGVGNLIPIFGPLISSAVAIIVVFISSGLWKSVWVAVFLVSAFFIESNIIQPKILSKSTGLSPLGVLISVLIGGGFFGFFGMILSVPVVAAIKNFTDDYLNLG